MGSPGIDHPDVESRLLQAVVYLANLKTLTDFCDHVGIDKQGVDTRSKDKVRR